MFLFLPHTNYQMNALERTRLPQLSHLLGRVQAELKFMINQVEKPLTSDVRLTRFYKIMTGLTPEYLRLSVPSLHGHLFVYRVTQMSLLLLLVGRMDIRIVSSQIVQPCGMIQVLICEEQKYFNIISSSEKKLV